MSELVERGACYMMLVRAGERLAWKDGRMRSPSNFSTADIDIERGQCTASYIASASNNERRYVTTYIAD